MQKVLEVKMKYHGHKRLINKNIKLVMMFAINQFALASNIEEISRLKQSTVDLVHQLSEKQTILETRLSLLEELVPQVKEVERLSLEDRIRALIAQNDDFKRRLAGRTPSQSPNAPARRQFNQPQSSSSS